MYIIYVTVDTKVEVSGDVGHKSQLNTYFEAITSF
jgi:hypothetical protein